MSPFTVAAVRDLLRLRKVNLILHEECGEFEYDFCKLFGEMLRGIIAQNVLKDGADGEAFHTGR